MGAISFSIDPQLVTALRKALPLALFIETGTFHGDSLEAVSGEFSRSVSVEASEELWRKAKARFQHRDDIDVLCGDSVAVLQQLRTSFEQSSTLFWLDAHWCIASDAVGEASQCPLLAELRAIGKLRPDSVILIDDARLFLCVPPIPHDISQWPSFSEILGELRRLSSDHELSVVNDVIAFYPSRAREDMETYARTYGADWLRAAQASLENQMLRSSLEEKEIVIRDLGDEMARLQHSLGESENQTLRNSLEEKEIVIKDLGGEMARLRRSFGESENQMLRSSLEEKEIVIRDLGDEMASLRRSLGESENQMLRSSLEEKEIVIRDLGDEMASLRRSLGESENQMLRSSLEEKEVAMRNLGDEMARLRRSLGESENQMLRNSLEEKERVIRDISIEAEKMRRSLAERKTLVGHLSAKLTDLAKWLWQRVVPGGRTRSVVD